ncbi:MAG: discoidin domain-containing protein, partial [Propionibacteriaceae bacterium]|nr:discoidin domain-containing protein [Propionibacteriaceae bacterium]
AGAKVIVSKSDSSYLDMKYNPKTPIGLEWAGRGDVDKYYNWNPRNVVPIAEEDDILGVEAPLWSESHRGGKQNEFLIFPRAISHAEIGWSQQSQRNVTDFMKRLNAIGPRLLAMQSNFYDGPLVAWGTDLAGLPAKARTNTSHRIEVAHFAAPGTKVSVDGKTVAVDSVNDADSASNSALTGPLTATIDFGDGSAAADATFETDTPRGVVSAGSLYRVGADHKYATAGSFDVTVTLSDGRVGTAKVTVANDYVVPVKAMFDDCQVPTMVLASTTARDDSRVGVTLTGLMPDEFLDILWDGTRIGSTVSDEDGNAFFSHYVPYQSVKGDHLLRVKDSAGRFVEKALTVDSQTVAPPGIAVTGVTAQASSEAPNEGAPNGVATALVDGNPATFWHSKWAAPAATYPHVLTFNLGKEVDLSQIVWTPRQNSDNGQVKTMSVEFSTDGTTWTGAKAVTLPAGRGTTAIAVDTVATHVRITATAPQAADSLFATAGEVQFRGLSEGQVEPEGPAAVEAETWTPPADCEVDPNPTSTVTVTTTTVTSTPTTTVTPTSTVTSTATVTASPTGAPSQTPTVTPTPDEVDVYSTPGYHTVNGRKWFTACEPYSQTTRCRTEIWSTQVHYTGGKFVSKTGWNFNNLTYLESKRSLWTGNPLGNAGSWTATNGRQWRTECDTPVTGGNGCRSYIWAPNTVEAHRNSDGSYRYELADVWVFNNIVRFSK